MPWFGHLARLEPPNGAVEEPPWLRAVQDSRGCGVWDGDAAGAVSVFEDQRTAPEAKVRAVASWNW